jgi:predicted  nucleic acid-binding Zn-ribbon protein
MHRYLLPFRSDCQELASLNKRVSEVTAVNSQLTKDNYQLRKTVNDLTEQNRQLQESHHRLVSQHMQDKRQMQEELQQLRGTMWEANTLSSPSLTYNQWGQTAYDPQATGQYYRQ